MAEPTHAHDTTESSFSFQRECRTLSSESYIIEQDDEDIGRIELHYTPAVTYGTLCLLERITEDEIRSLITEIDERFVMTNDPFREDFFVTVWNGREHATFSDEDFEDEIDDEFAL